MLKYKINLEKYDLTCKKCGSNCVRADASIKKEKGRTFEVITFWCYSCPHNEEESLVMEIKILTKEEQEAMTFHSRG